jgi:hypothetical protein
VAYISHSKSVELQKTMAFFTRRQKLKGTAAFAAGILLILFRWPLTGFLIELYGLFILFGDFLVTVGQSHFVYTQTGSSALLLPPASTSSPRWTYDPITGTLLFRWPLTGFLIELYGLFILFGDFLVTVGQFAGNVHQRASLPSLTLCTLKQEAPHCFSHQQAPLAHAGHTNFGYVNFIAYVSGISDAHRHVWRCPSTLYYTCDTA